MTRRELNDMLLQSAPNANHRVIVLIQSCIEDGIRGGAKIVAELEGLRYDAAHVRIQLHKNLGHLAHHRWHKDQEPLHTQPRLTIEPAPCDLCVGPGFSRIFLIEDAAAERPCSLCFSVYSVTYRNVVSCMWRVSLGRGASQNERKRGS